MNIQKVWKWLWNPPTDGAPATVVIRLMTGGVFLWEGILKFVYTNQGVGRFTKLGIPFPVPTAHFVAWVEITGGILFILGWLTRPVAIAFIIEMIVAILSTKMSLYLGKYPLPLPSSPPQAGIWAVFHEIRSDYAQIMTSIFLLVAGPGPIAMDAELAARSHGVRSSRLAAVAALLLLVAGTVRASGSESAGISATPAIAANFALGQKAIRQENYTTAAHFFRRSLAEEPNNPDVLNMLAFSERKQGHLDEAFEYYGKALALRPKFPEAREYVAEAHIQAALKELNTLKGYGPEGKEEAEDLAREFTKVVKDL